jgi:Asp-tRNA(Asn)/Glu-tRNA(Gln) amidotransferase A subunit family amidase
MAPYAGEGLGGLSTEHALTLSVRDSAALLDATCGAGPGDPYAAPGPERPFLAEAGTDPGKLRIGFTSVAPNGAQVEADSLRALAEAAKLCADLGHRVEEVEPEIDGAAVVPAFLTLASANTVVNLASHPTNGRPPLPGEVEKVTYATGQLGEKVTAADYIRATQTAHRLGRQMAAFHATYDVLLTPALATLPPKLGWIDMMMDDVHEYWRRVFHFSPFTVCFNLTASRRSFCRWRGPTPRRSAPPPDSRSRFSLSRGMATRRRFFDWPRSSRRRGRGSIASHRSPCDLNLEWLGFR